MGPANRADAYGEGLCTTACKPAPFCGDGVRAERERCDAGKSADTSLGACNPECTGYFEKKFIKSTYTETTGNFGGFDGSFGGPRGADEVCQTTFGQAQSRWKALLVGGGRIASLSPFKGDGQKDWVIQKYTHYFNETGELIWRTDSVALLGVRDGQRVNLYARISDRYTWSGWKTDWTESVGSPFQGHCKGWTSSNPEDYGAFSLTDLREGAGEPCDRKMPILCVEQ